MNSSSQKPSGSRRMPLWMRIILMVLLIITVAVAFYINMQKVFETMWGESFAPDLRWQRQVAAVTISLNLPSPFDARATILKTAHLRVDLSGSTPVPGCPAFPNHRRLV